MSDSVPVGRVLGTEDSTPLEFWVALQPGSVLQLDDVVATEREVPGIGTVKVYGVVEQVRARHVGARYESDVFMIEDGLLPAEVVEAAKVTTTRFEPEVFVPPVPGAVARKALGAERDEALSFDGMARRLPAGLSRDGEPVHLDLDFVDGTKGAHVNISGISGVATKTSYALFLLHGLFAGGALGHNDRALVFNVKGEDLLFLDRPNTQLSDEERQRYAALGLPAGAFSSVAFFAPPRRNDPTGAVDTSARTAGVVPFFWTIVEFCHQELLPFLFLDAEDDRQQFTIVIQNVLVRLREAQDLGDGAVSIDGVAVRTFDQLTRVVADHLLDEDGVNSEWAGRAIGAGTVNAFIRRLISSVKHVQHLVRADVRRATASAVDPSRGQVTVVDIHNLNDRAQRFVVGVVVRQLFEQKEREGRAEPRQVLVLDELNKYAPRQGTSPIKEVLLDVAERGRSLGIVLIGCQQTASEVERRIVANSSIRVVGRLDAAEAGREEYGFLPQIQRQRATILKPGTMIVGQPGLPVPLVVQFPFPAWATRSAEAAAVANDDRDPFEVFSGR
jgi:DNA helicase HerA-like ATPase